MELGLKGKHVIITGGGSNIGRAIVHAFAAEGSDISIAELVPSQGEIVAGEVAAMNTGSRVKVIPTDVTDPEKVVPMVEQAIAEFGPVNVLGEQRRLDGGPSVHGEAKARVGAGGPSEPLGGHQLYPCGAAGDD